MRLICIVVFFAGSLIPPYVPKAALASDEVSIASPQFLLVEEGFIMKSASLTRQGSRRAYAEGIIHTVKEGESLEGLASRYGIEANTIRWANKLGNSDVISPNDELLVLPVDGVLHAVSRGQTLIGISELYGVDQKVIEDQNNIKGSFILAGQELIIPGAKPIVGTPVLVATAEPPPVVEKPTVKPEPQTADDDPLPPVVTPPTPPPSGSDRDKAPAKYTPTPTSGVLQKPCSDACFITQYYRAGHYALDMQERGGGPIYAAEAGTVIRAEYGWNGGFGNVIEVDHGNDLITLYAHNKELYVEEGDIVKRGQMMSWMGHTGLVYGATGIHIHFEVRLKGVKKNPLLYIQ
ncbi:MAG: peptidoglycan DD-metalloendopeptidase family protein [Kiritimatiellales bacterium]|nr:peptidoglycan DD-metalloendopeptidase family protein [Kiritimatiellales bacterium]